MKIMSSFQNTFSSHSDEKLHESSMGNEDSGTSTEAETKPQDAVTGTVETQSAEGKPAAGTEQENIEELREFKKKYLAMEPELKELKKSKKEYDDYKADTDKRLAKIESEKVEGKIRNLIEKIPLVIFENKEDNREEEIKKNMKLYGKLSEDELLDHVREKFKLSTKLVEVSNKKSGLKESGFISNNAPAKNSENSETRHKPSILDAHKLFGGN